MTTHRIPVKDIIRIEGINHDWARQSKPGFIPAETTETIRKKLNDKEKARTLIGHILP